MIPNQDSFHLNAHYYNTQGALYRVHEKGTYEFIPAPLKIVLKNRQIVILYVLNNPWRTENKHDHQMVYQFCVFCKEKRFDNRPFQGPFEGFKEIKRKARKDILYNCQNVSCTSEKWLSLIKNLDLQIFNALFSTSHTKEMPDIIFQNQLKLYSKL